MGDETLATTITKNIPTFKLIRMPNILHLPSLYCPIADVHHLLMGLKSSNNGVHLYCNDCNNFLCPYSGGVHQQGPPGEPGPKCALCNVPGPHGRMIVIPFGSKWVDE